MAHGDGTGRVSSARSFFLFIVVRPVCSYSLFNLPFSLFLSPFLSPVILHLPGPPPPPPSSILPPPHLHDVHPGFSSRLLQVCSTWRRPGQGRGAGGATYRDVVRKGERVREVDEGGFGTVKVTVFEDRCVDGEMGGGTWRREDPVVEVDPYDGSDGGGNQVQRTTTVLPPRPPRLGRRERGREPTRGTLRTIEQLAGPGTRF